MNRELHPPSRDYTISRRALLKRAAAWSAGLGSAWLLAACGGDDGEGRLAAAQGEGGAETACAENGALSQQEVARRQGVRYVDQASDPARRCSACRFFKPEGADDGCGRCEIIPGRVAATGSCTAWVARG